MSWWFGREYEGRQVGGVIGRCGPREDEAYLVVVDPGDAWGRESVLSLSEVRRLLRVGYLEKGVVFERLKTQERFRVMQVDGTWRLLPEREEVNI